MGKISSYPENTNPSASDFLLGETATGPVTNRFKIQNIPGRTDKQYNSCKFSYYASAGQNIAAGTSGIIQYNTPNYDTGSNFSIVTFKFTAPFPGFYFFTGSTQMNPGGSGEAYVIQLVVNSTIVKQDTRSSPNGAAMTLAITDEVQLSVADTVYIAVVNGVSGIRGYSGGSAVTKFAGSLRSLT